VTKFRVEVTVTDRTEEIANGVETRAIHDVVSHDGQPAEATDDRYAQDKAATSGILAMTPRSTRTEYENGKVTSRSGSFEACVDGAQAGIIMSAHPRAGLAYRKEYYKGEAEDEAEVLSSEEQVEFPVGRFEGSLMTRDPVLPEPKVSEYKLYARDVDPVLDVQTSGGGSREKLISYSRAG